MVFFFCFFLLFERPSHIQKSGCGGVVAIPCHAPGGAERRLLEKRKKTPPHSGTGEIKRKALPPSPEGGVDLQGFAQHLGSDVVHVVPAQVHLPQAGVAAQGVDQDGPPGAQPGVHQGQRLQGLEEASVRKKKQQQRNIKLALKIIITQ